jgi:transposase-like protein
MPGGERKNADHALMLALACGATKEAAARKAGVSESTVYRRLREAGFQRELNEMRSDMVQRATAMLTAATMEAAKTLLALQDRSMPAPVRLGAAKATLDFGLKMRQTVELEVRLAAMEALLRDRQ